jgi:hypothetical protein
MKDANNLIEHLKRIEVYRIPGSDGPMMASVSEATLVRTIAGIEHLAAENARLTALVHQLGENAATAAREYAEGMGGVRENAEPVDFDVVARDAARRIRAPKGADHD